MKLGLAALRHSLQALGYGVLGVVVAFLTVFVLYLDSRPDLEPWHEATLDAEFTVDSPVASFEAYLELEDRLFEQLDEQVYDRLPPGGDMSIDRYARGSRADPSRWPRNWNRSFELVPKSPTVGVVMLHGMSDSPYSMRSLGQRLHQEGAWVVGLRVPGHGVAPAGLVDVRWQDMAAAVELAVAHVRHKVGDRPLYLVGYSNGGGLAAVYALSALEDSSLPAPDGLVLLSPEIGVAKVAVLASWQERLGHLLGLPKLGWNSILPEYDPYQYKSFAVNAGKQAYLVTQEIQERITRLADSGELDRFPPLLAFQSAVDATVSAPDVAERLFMRLLAARDAKQSDRVHELVLFDINRMEQLEGLLTKDPSVWLERVFGGREVDFAVTLLTNESKESQRVVARRRGPGDAETTISSLGLDWPPGVYSLAHIALPFPPKDPVYGGPDADPSPGVRLGNVALRGERGVLRVTGNDLLRMHWNPFHSYMEQRIVDFIH